MAEEKKCKNPPCTCARSRQTASTAAHHVKELATQSSLIVIAVTKCVREISELVFCGRSGGTDFSLWICGDNHRLKSVPRSIAGVWR